MGEALVINAVFDENILGYKIEHQSIMDIVLGKVLRLFEKKDIYILFDRKSSKYIRKNYSDFSQIEIRDESVAHVLSLIYNKLKGYDSVVYLFADEPLIDVNITRDLIKLHREEFADYSYGEGFIRGILPEIISTEILPRLAALDKEKSFEISSKDAIFNLLSKDINSFDIEAIFSDKDLRLMRFELTTSEKRYRLIVERLVSRLAHKNKDLDISYKDICSTIEDAPEIIRTVPSYIEIELTDRVHHDLPYLPISGMKRKRGEMEFDKYKKLLESLVNFTDRIYISISYLGEPLMHPDIKRIIKETVKIKKVTLVLETDGIDFSPDFANFVIDLNADNLTVIFQIDAIKDETYRKIHGTDIKYVERNVRFLLSKIKKNIYVQMVRMDINENEMLDFYRTWESEGAGVIIQKYNDFLGALPKLSTVDLKPLEKICCYHLMRDMVVFFDGTVPRCKQDINAKYTLGNVFKEPIEGVWSKGEPYFINHCVEKYDQDCRRCDEYYIFNF